MENDNIVAHIGKQYENKGILLPGFSASS